MPFFGCKETETAKTLGHHPIAAGAGRLQSDTIASGTDVAWRRPSLLKWHLAARPAVAAVSYSYSRRSRDWVGRIMMRILLVHERFGGWGGAEVNVYATARELRRRGYRVGLLHGPSTGKDEAAWGELFEERYLLGRDARSMAAQAVREFKPHLIYLHKHEDIEVLTALSAAPVPVVRMVHDHDLYCMRSYKYHPLTRHICRRPLSPYCLFPCGGMLTRKRSGGLPST